MSPAVLLVCLLAAADSSRALTPRRITLANGRRFTLDVAEELDVAVAAQGLRRARFMALSPDGRVFVTEMRDRSDTRRGAVRVLADFDSAAGRFRSVGTYLRGLRNPNGIAFWRDPGGAHWLYLALTDRLVRYRFTPGETAPASAPELLATFPDSGRSVAQGGWHLTRSIAVATDGTVYASVGSSCDACEELEPERAAILAVRAGATGRRIIARGLRNAVGIELVGDHLFVTNMGADHLGADRPDETMHVVRPGTDYGWPACYEHAGRVHRDTLLARILGAGLRRRDCDSVPRAYATFPAHAAPLGLEYFDSSAVELLRDSFLVALHGSGWRRLGRGYAIARVRRGTERGTHAGSIVTGFLRGNAVHGRPVDVMRLGADAFLVTDDHAGLVYYFKARAASGRPP